MKIFSIKNQIKKIKNSLWSKKSLKELSIQESFFFLMKKRNGEKILIYDFLTHNFLFYSNKL